MNPTISMSVICPANRRDFLKSGLAATGVGAMATLSVASTARNAGVGLIDVNVSLARWPTRRVAGDDTSELVSRLHRSGVTQAWAGSFDGLLHKDLAGVNARLAEDCRKHRRGFLQAFGSINPMLPDWEEELRRCAENHRMAGIRLHPNYHGYKLDDSGFASCLRLAAEHRLIVQLAVTMEDERMMHPLLRVPPVDTTPLLTILRQTPSLRIVLLNALGTLRGKPLLDVLSAGEVYVEISMLEGIGGVGKLLEQVPADRVLFGSHSPLFYFESAYLKLKESPLTAEQLNAIRAANARRIQSR